MSDDTPSIGKIEFGVVLLVVVAVGYGMFDAATGPEMQNYVENAEEWCDDRDGELYNSNSVVHGGLHCELPNGTVVHVSKVVEYGQESRASKRGLMMKTHPRIN